MTCKNEITALITASMTQRHQAVDVAPIITYNVRRSRTNCFECNEIFTFPSKYFSSIRFEPFCLSLDEVRAWKENLHVIVYVRINFALCTCLSRMHLGTLLVFCVSAPDWAWQLCTLSCYGTQAHRQREKERHQMLCLNGLSLHANLSTVILLMSCKALIS